MEIVLLERIEKLGQMGDVVKVRDGYARNFLIPQGKALRANKQNLEHFEKERTQLEARNLKLKGEAEQIAKKLDGSDFIAIRQSSESGQLYGSVSSRDIAALVTEGGASIQRGQIYLSHPIKALGVYKVSVSLHPEVNVEIEVNVARSSEEAERQARGEDVLADAEAKEQQEESIAVEEVFEEEVLAEQKAAEEAEQAQETEEAEEAEEAVESETEADKEEAPAQEKD
ncbi:MAG: 50S ribosomal protein L9 [Parvibaculales bacterium]